MKGEEGKRKKRDRFQTSNNKFSARQEKRGGRNIGVRKKRGKEGRG